LAEASLPGLTRQSIVFKNKMDARIKSAHDGGMDAQVKRATPSMAMPGNDTVLDV